MDSSLLHVILVNSNPMRWASRDSTMEASIAHMLASGVQLTVVECAFGDRPFKYAGRPEFHHVAVRGKTRIWNKENLFNIGLARLSMIDPGWKFVAQIDADVIFRKANWASETVDALQLYDVVQPWAQCYDLGPKDEHLLLHTSLCKLHHDGKPIMQGPKCGPNTPYTFGHPGYAWAYTRAFLEQVGGLIEEAALGAADHHMAMALLGRVMDTVPYDMHVNYISAMQRWEKRALAGAALNVGVVHGNIEHLWHGSKDKRKYIDRWSILKKHNFDPVADMKKNTFGVLEWAGTKPLLHNDVTRYFGQRDEDANTL